MLYLLQVIIYTALMYGIYMLFLRNRTMHNFNRGYLLASAFLPLVLPLIKLSPTATTPLQRATIQGIRLPEVTIGPDLQSTATNVLAIAALAYGLVIMVLLFFKTMQWYKLQQVISKNEKIQDEDYILVINSGYGPGSWGKYIFIPAEATNDTIINHELAHIQLHHTADVMLLDILRIFFWPNIFLIWLHKELVQVHEFQADEIAATEKHAYAQLLVSSLFHTCTLPSTHSFIIHPIKRRIKMLNKKNNPVPRFVAMLATGVAMSLLLANVIAVQSCNTKKYDAKNDGKTTILTSVMPDGAMYHTSDGKCVYFRKDEVQKIVAKMPAFNGDLATYIGKTIEYPKEAMDRNVQGKVMTRFVVTKDGDIVNVEIVKSPDSLLSAAALRVINTMPVWIPGETETGEKVPVEFILPIQFKL